MARIRSIRPEFWDDEEIALLSRDARLLLIACKNMADDEGLMRWTAPYLKANAFMYDDDVTIADIERLMGEIAGGGFVFPYRGGKAQQSLGWIINWDQKPNRPQPSKLPPPSWHNPQVREAYGERDGWMCQICGEEIHRTIGPGRDIADYGLSIDHNQPRSKGGSDYPSNLRAVHHTCNKRKGDDWVEDVPGPENSSLDEDVDHSLNEDVSESVNGSSETRAPFTAVVVGEGRVDVGEGRHSVIASPPPDSSPAPPMTATVIPLRSQQPPEPPPPEPASRFQQTTWDLFWARWPCKHHKQAAQTAWRYRGDSDQVILEGLDRWNAYWQADATEDRHIPHASRWLRERYWREPTPSLARRSTPRAEANQQARAAVVDVYARAVGEHEALP